MQIIDRILRFTLLFAILMFLQGNRLLEIGGVTPNLLLIALFIAVFTLPPSRAFRVTAIVAVGIVVLSVWWFPFWIPIFIVLAIVAAVTAVIRPFLAGNVFIDFALSAGIATFVLYAVARILFSNSMPWLLVGGEMIYTLLLGEGALLLLMRKARSL